MLIEKCSCAHHSLSPLCSRLFRQRQELKLAQISGRQDLKRTLFLYSLYIFLFRKRQSLLSVCMPYITVINIIYCPSEPYRTTLYFAKLHTVTDRRQKTARVSNFTHASRGYHLQHGLSVLCLRQSFYNQNQAQRFPCSQEYMGLIQWLTQSVCKSSLLS